MTRTSVPPHIPTTIAWTDWTDRAECIIMHPPHGELTRQRVFATKEEAKDAARPWLQHRIQAHYAWRARARTTSPA